MNIIEAIDALVVKLQDAEGKHPKDFAERLSSIRKSRSFSSLNFYLTELLGLDSLSDTAKASILSIQESIKPNIEAEGTERDRFGNLKSRAEFESHLAMSLLTGADTSVLQRINQKMVDYLEKHKAELADKNYAILASLEQYKIPFSRELSPIDALIALLKRPLDGPDRAKIICESASLHLLFFNYRSVYQPEREAQNEEDKSRIVAEKAQLHRKLRPKNPGEMFDETTRGRERVSSVFRTSDFGITEPESTLAEWRNFHRYQYTPHKYRVSPNPSSAIVKTFQSQGVPFIAGPSGTAGDCLEGLHFLMPELTSAERQSYLNLLAASEVGLGHHSMHEIMLTACNIEALPQLYRDDVANDKPVWERINYQSSYESFLTESFKQSDAGLQLKEAYPQFFTQKKETPKPVTKPKPKMDIETATIKLQRQFRAKSTSKIFHKASYWIAHERAFPESAIDKTRFFIKEKSHYNLQQLKKEFEDPAQKMSEKEKRFLRFFMSCNFELSHYTNQTDKIINSGMLLSYDRLKERLGSGFVQSSSTDINSLGNSGYVFFRMELLHQSKMKSRFGSDQFVFNGRNTDFLEHGFVSLYEMLVPYTASTCKLLLYKGKKVRSYQESSDINGRFNYQYQTQLLPFDVADTVFYGHDIMEGIALAFLREIRRIGGEFQADFLELFEKSIADEDSAKFSIDPTSQKYQETLSKINKILSDLFRLEAKIPSVVYIKDGHVKISKAQELKNAIDNGDFVKIESILSAPGVPPFLPIPGENGPLVDPMSYALATNNRYVVNFLLEKKVNISIQNIDTIKEKFHVLSSFLSQEGFQYFLKQFADISLFLGHLLVNSQAQFSKIIPLLTLEQLKTVFSHHETAEALYLINNCKSSETYQRLLILLQSNEVKEDLKLDTTKNILMHQPLCALIINCLKLGDHELAWKLFSPVSQYINVYQYVRKESIMDVVKNSKIDSPFVRFFDSPTPSLLMNAINAEDEEEAIILVEKLQLTYSDKIEGKTLLDHAKEHWLFGLMVKLVLPMVLDCIKNNDQTAAFTVMQALLSNEAQKKLVYRMIGDKSVIQLALENDPQGAIIKYFQSDNEVMLFLNMHINNEEEAIKYFNLMPKGFIPSFNGISADDLALKLGMKKLYQMVRERKILNCIYYSDQLRAKNLFNESDNSLVSIFHEVDGKSLLQSALQNYPKGELIEYVKSDPDVLLLCTLYIEGVIAASQLMKARQLTMSSIIGGKSITQWVTTLKGQGELDLFNSLEKLKTLLQFPRQEAALLIFTQLRDPYLIFLRIDGKTILQHAFEGNPKGALTDHIMNTLPNMDLYIAFVSKNEKQIRRIIQEKKSQVSNGQEFDAFAKKIKDWAQEFGYEHLLNESIAANPTPEESVQQRELAEQVTPKETASDELSDVQFKLIMSDLLECVKTPDEFQSVMKDLSNSQKGKFFEAIKSQLASMLKTKFNSISDFLAILSTLTPKQVTLFSKSIITQLASSPQKFIGILKELSDKQKIVFYEEVKPKLHEMIKTADDYTDLLSTLPETCAMSLRGIFRKKLITLIHTTGDFIKIFNLIPKHERGEIYYNIQERLPELIKSIDELNNISSFLSEEDLDKMILLWIDKVSKAEDFYGLLKLTTSDAYRHEIFQKLIAKLPDFINDPYQLFCSMALPSKEDSAELIQKIKGKLPILALSNISYFHVMVEILSQEKQEIIQDGVKSFLMSWVQERLTYLETNQDVIALGDYYREVLPRISSADNKTIWDLYKEIFETSQTKLADIVDVELHNSRSPIDPELRMMETIRRALEDPLKIHLVDSLIASSSDPEDANRIRITYKKAVKQQTYLVPPYILCLPNYVPKTIKTPEESITKTPTKVEFRDEVHYSTSPLELDEEKPASPTEGQTFKEKLVNFLSVDNKRLLSEKLGSMRSFLISEKDNLLITFIETMNQRLESADRDSLSEMMTEIDNIYQSISSPEMKVAMDEINHCKTLSKKENDDYAQQAEQMEKALLNIPLAERGTVITGAVNDFQMMWQSNRYLPSLTSSKALEKFNHAKESLLQLKRARAEETEFMKKFTEFKSEIPNNEAEKKLSEPD